MKRIEPYAFGCYMVDGTMYKIAGFKIICVKNSAAYNYAVENGISYKLIPENVKNFKQENATYNSVTLKWSKVDKATRYIIKQYRNGKCSQIKRILTTITCICYYTLTLCTAYKTTVQTEQAVTEVMESGHISDSGIFSSTGQ